MSRHFQFVLNPIIFHGNLPVEIIPNHWFEKANEEQVNIIKSLLAGFGPFSNLQFRAYESTVQQTQHQGGSGFTFLPLDPIDWKYHVVSFEGYNDKIETLQQASLVLEHDFEFGLEVLVNLTPDGRFGYGWKQNAHSYFSADTFGKRRPIELCESDIVELREIYHLIVGLNAEYKHIAKALQILCSLKALPRDSDTVISRLFTIIESLVTHKPRDSESVDSLTHQITTKFHLVKNRFRPTLEYPAFFGQAKEEKIWAELYGFRSSIVHSGESELKTRPILKSRTNVVSFLEQAVKLLVFASLKDPQLLTDLRQC